MKKIIGFALLICCLDVQAQTDSVKYRGFLSHEELFWGIMAGHDFSNGFTTVGIGKGDIYYPWCGFPPVKAIGITSELPFFRKDKIYSFGITAYINMMLNLGATVKLWTDFKGNNQIGFTPTVGIGLMFVEYLYTYNFVRSPFENVSGGTFTVMCHIPFVMNEKKK